MPDDLERRLGTLLGLSLAVAWLLFELYAGLEPARGAGDCGCDAEQGPPATAGQASADSE